MINDMKENRKIIVLGCNSPSPFLAKALHSENIKSELMYFDENKASEEIIKTIEFKEILEEPKYFPKPKSKYHK